MNFLYALSKSFEEVNGEVHWIKIISLLIAPSFFSISVIECKIPSSEDESSAERFFGLFIVFAPFILAIFKYSSESLDTYTFVIDLLWMAALIENSNNLVPWISWMFLFNIPFEPDLAKIIAERLSGLLIRYGSTF